jgi:hypothetical protein
MYRAGLSLRQDCRSRVKVLAIILGIASVMTYMSWSRLGTHNEGVDDPISGFDDTIRDYMPTAAQRNRAATTILLLTKKMLERYSHIRMTAKRKALDAIVQGSERSDFGEVVHQNVHQLGESASNASAKPLN